MENPEDGLLCQPCFIKGDVSFGKGCIVHPSASIIAENGPIKIGDYNIIEERTLIQNKGERDISGQFKEAPLVIRNYNIFEIESTIEHCKIGDYNRFEHKGNKTYFTFLIKIIIAHVENGGVVGNGCILGALSRLSARKKLFFIKK